MQVAKKVPSRKERERAKREQRARVAELDARIGVLCANIDAAKAELVDALGQFDDLDGWHDQYATGAPQWLAWRANVSPRAGREMLALAQALKKLPKVKDAFSSGRLTYWQTRTIAKVAEESTQEILIYLAQHCTVAQLQRICSAYARASRLQAPASAPERERRMLGYHFDDDGFMELYARLCPEDAAVFQKALEAVAERMRKEQEQDTVTQRSSGQRGADALVEMARASLAGGGEKAGGAVSGPSHEVMVHVDLDALASGDGRCHLQDGPPLAPKVVERILCDSFVTTAVEKNDAVIDVSKRRRTATARQKKALLARDQMCVFPGCTRGRFLDAHHVRFYTRDGGETSYEDLRLLCRFHHVLVHEGEVSMVCSSNGNVVFEDGHGKVIEPVPAKPEGSVGRLAERNRARGLTLTSETPRSGWDGEPVSLFDCGDAIFRAREEHERAFEDPPPEGGPDPPGAGAPGSDPPRSGPEGTTTFTPSA